MRVKVTLFISSLVLLDTLSKILFTQKLPVGDKFEVIPEIFWLELAENKGFAFGLGKSFSWVLIPLYIVAVIVILRNLNLLEGARLNLGQKGMLFLLAGVLGNTFDRIVDGKVTDFLAVRNFAIFNFADSFITVGLLIIIYNSNIKEIKKN